MATTQFGEDHGLLHEVVVTGRKVGAGKEFWAAIAHNEELFARVVAFVMSFTLADKIDRDMTDWTCVEPAIAEDGEFEPVLQEWGIQAVFSAHVHAYEHYEEQGIHYFTLGTGGAPWFLYGIGAVFAVASELCGVSGLAFALGMYLPMELNSPLVLGAAIAWLLQRSSPDAALAKARHEKGTLIASGFIAGGALVGVLAALLKFLEESAHIVLVPDLTRVAALGIGAWMGAWGNWVGLGTFLLLGAAVYWDAHREKAE